MGSYGSLWRITDRFSEYKPYAEKLFLHSGAITQPQNPATDAQPNGRKRDKATLQAKAESQKRKLEAQVAAEVASPAKKVSISLFGPLWGIMAHSNPLHPRLVARSSTLRNEIFLLRPKTWQLRLLS